MGFAGRYVGQHVRVALCRSMELQEEVSDGVSGGCLVCVCWRGVTSPLMLPERLVGQRLLNSLAMRLLN